MLPVRVYTTNSCPYCTLAMRLLKSKEVAFEAINVDDDHDMRMRLVELTGQRTVPQIFFGERSIGGFDELNALIRSGGLEAALAD